jgi:glycosyltransferase involved in cell wall biosynthesis
MTALGENKKPRVALLRGPLLNPYEMQTYELLKDDFDLVALGPHETYFDTSSLDLPQETLWCPIAGKIPFERELRKWQALRDQATGQTHSFCGLRDRLQGFDLYHIMDQYFCFSYEAALAKRRFGGKLVVSQWENIAHHNEKKMMERHIKKTVRDQADLFLAMSQMSKDALVEEGVAPERIVKLFGAVDTGHFSPGRPDPGLLKKLGIPLNAEVLLYVGRLSRSKGVFCLLEAFRELASRHKRLRLLLVGKDEEGVAAWVEKNTLGGRVHLAGFVPYAQMPNYYRLARYFILPSLPSKGQQEQFGYVLAEAMACGVPVLGSRCGAIPEVIDDRERIFEPDSAAGLGETLERLRRKPLGVLRAKARERAHQLFSTRALAKRLGELYRGLLDGN